MHGLGVTAMTARCTLGKLQVTTRARQQITGALMVGAATTLAMARAVLAGAGEVAEMIMLGALLLEINY